MVLLGWGRLLIGGRLGLLLLLLLPGGGLQRRLLVGAGSLLRGPVARLLLVGLRVLLIAWVLQVHRSRGCEVTPLNLQVRGCIRLWDWLSSIVTKKSTLSEGSWPCAAAAWQCAVLQGASRTGHTAARSCACHEHGATSHLRLLDGVGIVLLVLCVWVPASLLLLRGRLLRGMLLVHLLIWLLCKASRRLHAVSSK